MMANAGLATQRGPGGRRALPCTRRAARSTPMQGVEEMNSSERPLRPGLVAALAGIDVDALRAQMLATLEAHRPQLEAAIRGHREACAEVERLGLPAPDDIEGMIHIARVVGIPEREIDGLTWREVYGRLLAFVDRERLRLRLRQENSAPSGWAPGPPGGQTG